MNTMRTLMQIVEGAEKTVAPILTEAAIKMISPKEARDRGMFGPVYHGTQNIDAIMSGGFSVERAEDDASNGYQFQPYSRGGSIPAPRHHLGNGIYFTTSKTIAKSFNGNSVRGLKEFWLDIPNHEEINFGSTNTMMRWWHQNGYHPSDDILRKPGGYREWIEQTRALTDTLRSKWDAVWFKGKGMRRLLDGDQVCVYDASRIYAVDNSLAGELEVGSKVVHNQSPNPTYSAGNEMYLDDIEGDSRFTGWRSYYRAVDFDGNDLTKANAHPLHKVPPAGMVGVIVGVRERPAFKTRPAATLYDVKWAKGGVQHNYAASELSPAPIRQKKV